MELAGILAESKVQLNESPEGLKAVKAESKSVLAIIAKTKALEKQLEASYRESIKVVNQFEKSLRKLKGSSVGNKVVDEVEVFFPSGWDFRPNKYDCELELTLDEVSKVYTIEDFINKILPKIS